MKKPLRNLILPMAREQLIQAREPTAIAFQVEEHRQGASRFFPVDHPSGLDATATVLVGADQVIE